MRSKGLSPLVATILLVGITVSVAALVSFWVKDFVTSISRTVANNTESQMKCVYGSIALSDVNYCANRNELSGRIINNEIISFNTVTLQIIYTNGSSPFFPLCLSGSNVVSCGFSNLTISPGYIYAFNISGITNGFSFINIITDCVGVTDIVDTWNTNC